MRRVLLWGSGAVALVGAGVVVWFFWVSSTPPPGTDVTAPPLDTSSTTATSAAAAAGDNSTTTTASDGGEVVLLTLGEGTRAVFELDEELRGQPKHVVAETPDVVGQVEVNLADAGESRIGEILINARTFTTDSGLRDRAIRGPILDAGTHEFIRFAPTALVGLEGPVEVGETVEFQVEGDLSIRDVTRPVTFDVTATLVAEDRLEGVATTTVLRSDFGLQIPNVASVANVTDEVVLTLEFVAVPT